jgi:hypothetical protein
MNPKKEVVLNFFFLLMRERSHFFFLLIRSFMSWLAQFARGRPFQPEFVKGRLERWVSPD